MLYNAATFAPFAIAAWLMLDRYSVSRFSIGYAPMFAIFAADGIARITRRPQFEAILGGALIGGFVIYTWPALNISRRTVSPSVLGVEAVRQHLDPRATDLYVAFPMSPFIDTFLPYYPYRQVFDERGLPLTTPVRPTYFLTEVYHTRPTGWVFRRDRGALWNIARRHYFEVALESLPQSAKFISGWYPPERNGVDEFRWMAARSVTMLPPGKGTTKLRIQFDVPDELMPSRPTVTFLVNGAVLDRFQPAEAHLVREYDVTPCPGANRLEIQTDRTLNSQRSDPRELGLLVRYLSWGPE